MGPLHGENGGERPSEESALPGLPPEWGPVVVPDDAAELAAEAALVRRHLRGEARRRRWRRRLGLRATPVRRRTGPHEVDGTMRTPLLVMTIAILATIVSLFAVGLPTSREVHGRALTDDASAQGLLSITLSDTTGRQVRLWESVPAVFLIVDGCRCENLIEATVDAAPPGVTVVGISSGAVPDARSPTPPVLSGSRAALPDSAAGTPLTLSPPLATPRQASPAARRQMLVDTDRRARAALPSLVATTGPSAVLVDGAGRIVRVVPVMRSVSDVSAGLPRLTG